MSYMADKRYYVNSQGNVYSQLAKGLRVDATAVGMSAAAVESERVPYSAQDLGRYGGKSERWSLSRSRVQLSLNKISHSAKRSSLWNQH